MYSYLLLSLVFIAVALIAVQKYIRKFNKWRALSYTFLIMFVLTFIFDNLLIHFDIVTYYQGNILGLKSLYAPIEDYSYMLVVTLVGPIVWSAVNK